MTRFPRILGSPKLMAGFLAAVIISSFILIYAASIGNFKALTSTLGSKLSTAATFPEDLDSTSSAIKKSKYLQVLDDTVFEAPKGVPLIPSFNNYFTKEDYIHPDADEDESMRRKLHFSNYLYRGYDVFVRTFGLEETARKTSLDQKCKVFFDQLTQDDPEWEVKEIDRHDMRIVNKADIIAGITKKVNEEWGVIYPGFAESEDGKYNIEKKYEDQLKDTLRSAQDSADDITITRIYGKCFFNDDSDRDMDTYRTYSSKVFPYLSETPPKFCRGNSDSCLEGRFPVYDDDSTYRGESEAFNPDTDNFLEFMRTNITGKGIVISAINKHEKLLTNLLRLLRANNNKLPIQIVHRGDLDRDVQKRLQAVATESVEDMFDRDFNKEELQVLPHIDVLLEAKNYGITFPQQDLWFVDVTPCLSVRYGSKFSEFRNKILAYFLNSFSEVIVMDADTVPLVPTTDYFRTSEYLETGTHLFKDRSLMKESTFMQLNTVTRLMPVNDRSIDSLFGIPKVTKQTLGNDYMLGWYHMAESGLVVVDRKRHFTSLLIALYLAFSNQYLGSVLYGDKEFFWMSLAMAGGEDYAFNRYRAGAVGKSVGHTEHAFDPKSGSRTLVSSHPGHVSADGRLLWINSGAAYCKKEGWDSNMNKQYYKEYSVHELQVLFGDPVRLEAVLVPPELPALYKPRLPYTTVEMERMENAKHYFKHDRNKNHLLEEGSTFAASQLGWKLFNGCGNYDYGAYEKIASFDENELYDYGTYFEFSEDDNHMHDYLGKVWLNLGLHKKKVDGN